jgi:hypothetical protein
MPQLPRTVLALAALTFVALVPAVTLAGPVGGSIIKTDVVLGRSIDTYKVALRGGEVTTVVVSGDGSTDLDLYVYDQFGDLVAKDDDLTDQCAVRFFVPGKAVYTIKVVNNGRVPNRYVLGVR